MKSPERESPTPRERVDRSSFVIAIDGSTTAGKRIVAEQLANRYDLTVLNTGTTIRALALLAIESRLVQTDETNVTTIPSDFIEKVTHLFESLGGKFAITKPRKDERLARVKVGKRDMHGELLAFRKQKAIDNLSSIIASSPQLRSRLSTLWKDAVEDLGGVVVIGRRVGIDLLPDAHVKVYLFASPEASATYRVLHDPTATLRQRTEELYVRERDGRDRETGLLERPADALVIDTSEYITNPVGIEALESAIASHIDARYDIR